MDVMLINYPSKEKKKEKKNYAGSESHSPH
jgi:hypothetical protein